MLEETERNAINAYVQQDPRPWHRLSAKSVRLMGDFLVEVSTVDRAAANELAEAARALGFEARLYERVTRSDSAHDVIQAGIWFVKVVAATGSAVIGLNAFVKAINELPENARKLLEKFRGSKGRLQLHEGFDLPTINRWLDGRFGVGGWRYDPGRIEVKPVAEVMIFAVPEEVTGCLLLLAVRDGEVEEITVKRLASPTDDPPA